MVEFAKMFNYPPMFIGNAEEGNQSWGHFTCGGTVANCESFWAARNCKFLAFSFKLYIEQELGENAPLLVKNIMVNLPDGSSKKLLELSTW